MLRACACTIKLQPGATKHRENFISYHLPNRRQIKMRAKIEQLKKRGQGLVEYALILVLIAIVVILILTFLGQQVNSTFSKIGSGLGG
jgi:pilus assembly protein Flp/PilA